MSRDIPYPTTIVQSRYSGVYSGGVWLAFPCYPEILPDGWEDSDPFCMNFWDGYEGLVGKGDSPNSALEDLCKQMKSGKP